MSERYVKFATIWAVGWLAAFILEFIFANHAAPMFYNHLADVMGIAHDWFAFLVGVMSGAIILCPMIFAVLKP